MGLSQIQQIVHQETEIAQMITLTNCVQSDRSAGVLCESVEDCQVTTESQDTLALLVQDIQVFHKSKTELDNV